MLIREYVLRYAYQLPFPSLPPEAMEIADVSRMIELLSRLQRKMPFLNASDAGAVARFTIALAAVSPGQWTIDGTPRLRQRPMAPLLDVFHQWQVPITYHDRPGFLPITINGRPQCNHSKVEMDLSHSSQFISALILIAPRLRLPLHILFKNPPVSSPYIHMSLHQAQRYGLQYTQKANGVVLERIVPRANPSWIVEGDWSGALFLALMPVVIPSLSITLFPLRMQSLQGDVQVVQWLRSHGLLVTKNDNTSICFSGTTSDVRNHLNYNGTPTPDAIIPLAVALTLRQVPFTIRGITHLDYKESPRLVLLCRLLRALGAIAICSKGALEVRHFGNLPSSLHIESHNDHRIAMLAGLISLKVPQVTISRPTCTAKSFPGYWSVLRQLGWQVIRHE